MNILKNAKEDFKAKIAGELECIEVPEWGEGGEPARIYYRKVMSLKTQNQINQYAKDGSLEALAEIIILRALDADGKRLFKPANKTEFMNFVDPEVMARITQEMAEDDTTLEDAQGN